MPPTRHRMPDFCSFAAVAIITAAAAIAAAASPPVRSAPADLEGKWRLNEFAVGCGESELCLRIARMNHACDPNAFTWRDEERGVRVVVTGRPIAAGEEVTFAYSE